MDDFHTKGTVPLLCFESCPNILLQLEASSHFCSMLNTIKIHQHFTHKYGDSSGPHFDHFFCSLFLSYVDTYYLMPDLIARIEWRKNKIRIVTIVALQNRSILHYTKNFMQIDRFEKILYTAWMVDLILDSIVNCLDKHLMQHDPSISTLYSLTRTFTHKQSWTVSGEVS